MIPTSTLGYPNPRTALCALSVLLVLLSLALGMVHAQMQPAETRLQTIALDDVPDAVALDPGAERAFVASASAGTVSLLDLAQGRVLRRVRVGTPGTLAPLALALDPATHRLVVADRTDAPVPGRVTLLDSRSGAPIASIQVGHEAAALAVDARHGHVLVANETDGTLSLLDGRSGTVLHSVALGLLPLALALDEHRAHAFVIGALGADAIAAPAVLATGGLLDVLDTTSGTLLARTPLGSGASELAVDAVSGRVFVACAGDRTVRVLDARSGTPLGTVALAAPPSALAVDARRGRVYVISAAAGTLSLLDARSGRLLGTWRVDPFASSAYALPDALAVDEARDRVYLSTYGPLDLGQQGLTLRGGGTLYVLDARTGAVRGRIAVGVAPQALAVEAGSGRVVVVNAGGDVLRSAGIWAAPWFGSLRAWWPWLDRLAPPGPASVHVAGSVSVVDPAGL